MLKFLVIALAAAAVLWAITAFNRLVHLRNRARGSWSDIDVQLERRHDLIGNLVEVVKGYVEHERSTLEKVVQARAMAEEARTAQGPVQAGAAEGRLTGFLHRLLAVVEAYPDLKASDRFLDLQRSLTQVEDDLQNARRYYNAVVRDLNTRIQSIPDLVVARALGFREREFFELEGPDDAAAPRVEMTP